ncbi:Uncharacterised protein [Shigella sonnei]|uniref:Uncharacterized protein n=1 Tax=Escherichia coli TaxID=562 RepID=A0A2X1QMR0_ECOLX|nr:Uncharacterised protein [Shigella sonnei]SPX23011.1 Uncharacterised protein [Escherichia coli]STM08458.1 Uncharacterised protein [Escherichia coli]STM08540.1 Uncharacterised protein [Escherichia coli]
MKSIILSMVAATALLSGRSLKQEPTEMIQATA